MMKDPWEYDWEMWEKLGHCPFNQTIKCAFHKLDYALKEFKKAAKEDKIYCLILVAVIVMLLILCRMTL